MYGSLIVMTFEREDEAPRVYETLQRMRSSPLPDPANVAAVTKDSQGRLAVTQKRELLPAGQAAGDKSFSSAISLLFGEPPEEQLQALAKDGFDDVFRQRVRETMGNNSSALLILMKRGTQVDRGRLFGILNLFDGQVSETTLPPKVEAALAEGWED
jgi:uncharacterized membrane protein